MRGTKLFILLLFIVIIIAGVIRFGKFERIVPVEMGRLRIGENVVAVEMAKTPEEWSQGLSGRESLLEEEGMLFVSDESVRRTFWMKGMRFPLDMLFINQGKVVDIAHKVPAPGEGEDGTETRVSTWLPATWVLEVNSGWAERHGVKLGDPVVLEGE
ncbi:MAG: hypothetical protein A2900_00060 [Candidatus Chisholmbacteria bacterium RIFCSPLOWO2_01_FULL_50_28]|uniref:DUF192 domain-containing protein n=1 Tax=Candidatus Chisholmbacteria bacterium RIFCSPHIGHO2_01_FULL_52_32 TaxID=1797591 RepID=A0A1G1VQU4_9BACT|nr:MAG: hypothetical protein A2786_00295 [Candidatus Chisholmbacteria bacterium RIFCSPHIGHO2_01_FULL_52_32]OGY20721.1 MAG: hypothetical protein A2900_00060 [Candidatus Chisholmbacteria bacterium RIFCSPLOWO2_01_FULL_50_28]